MTTDVAAATYDVEVVIKVFRDNS